jgi:hypothetical protein
MQRQKAKLDAQLEAAKERARQRRSPATGRAEASSAQAPAAAQFEPTNEAEYLDALSPEEWDSIAMAMANDLDEQVDSAGAPAVGAVLSGGGSATRKRDHGKGIGQFLQSRLREVLAKKPRL